MEIGNSDNLVVGEPVVAIGCPAGIEYLGTVTDGIISAINRDIEITDINWLDDFLYWQAKDQTIVVRDFNGDNRREILNETLGNLPVVISANNRYLYYFTSEETPVLDKTNDTTKESTITSEESAANSSNSEDTANIKTIYHLTREKL